MRDDIVKVNIDVGLRVSETHPLNAGLSYCSTNTRIIVSAEYLCKCTTMVVAGHKSLTPPVACGAVTCGSSEVPIIVAHHFNTPYNKRLIYQSVHKLYNTATFIVQKTLACNNRRLDDAPQ